MNPHENPFPPGSPSTSSGKSAPTSKMTPLADDFHPGNDDVICGRGKKCYNHIGNTRFRQRVIGMLDDYANAKSKLDKSSVLSRVMNDVRRASPGGGFIKQDESGKWFEVGDFLAREKTSQAFRDALHERYKSSNVSKKKKRQQELAKAADKAQRIARSEQEISSRLESLSSELMRSSKFWLVCLFRFVRLLRAGISLCSRIRVLLSLSYRYPAWNGQCHCSSSTYSTSCATQC